MNLMLVTVLQVANAVTAFGWRDSKRDVSGEQQMLNLTSGPR